MQSVQIAASEIWVTLIFCGILYLFRNELNQKKVTKMLLIACITRLVSDAVSWAFDGMPGLFLGVMTRISNYLTFVSNDVVSLLFSVFMWKLISDEAEKPDIVLKAYWVLETIAIGALTLNLYFGWFYSFDSNNGYSRGNYYQLTHVAPAAALFIILWLLVKYHSKFSKNQKFLGWTYFILMTGATIYEYMNFGLSLQTYAQTFSALIAFFVGEIEIRQNLLITQEELKKKNEELKKEEKKAEAANIAKSNFLFSMSHDIRTPMNAIIGYTQLIEKELNCPEEIDRKKILDYQEKIKHSGNLLLSIINNVLDMARIESGKAELDEEYLDTEAVITELISVFESDARKKNIKIHSHWDVQHRYFMADQTKIKEIFLNIISNAIKYTPEGGAVTIRATELPCDRDGYLCVKTEIEDTGIGMSKEYLPYLFEPFTREHNSTTAKVIGTGLGMPIVKKLVELMGGSIEVESEPGKGTRFTLILYHRLADEAGNVDKTEISDKEKKEVFQGKHILLAEDNELNAEIAGTILEEGGFLVDRVEDGLQCVEKIRQMPVGSYDLILMDIQMPNMEGYEATHAIRGLEDKAKASIPIVAMTANAFEEDRKMALSQGMNAHIAKPMDIGKIEEVLFTILK